MESKTGLVASLQQRPRCYMSMLPALHFQQVEIERAVIILAAPPGRVGDTQGNGHMKISPQAWRDLGVEKQKADLCLFDSRQAINARPPTTVRFGWLLSANRPKSCSPSTNLNIRSQFLNHIQQISLSLEPPSQSLESGANLVESGPNLPSIDPPFDSRRKRLVRVPPLLLLQLQVRSASSSAVFCWVWASLLF